MKRMTTILISIMYFSLLIAPPNNSGMIFVSEPVNPFQSLWIATTIVESGGNPYAIGDRHLKEWSYGISQIRRVRLDDYFRRTGIRYTTDDMFCPEKSREVFMFYASQYRPHEIESISRSWNGSGVMTKIYFAKIKKHL